MSRLSCRETVPGFSAPSRPVQGPYGLYWIVWHLVPNTCPFTMSSNSNWNVFVRTRGPSERLKLFDMTRKYGQVNSLTSRIFLAKAFCFYVHFIPTRYTLHCDIVTLDQDETVVRYRRSQRTSRFVPYQNDPSRRFKLLSPSTLRCSVVPLDVKWSLNPFSKLRNCCLVEKKL